MIKFIDKLSGEIYLDEMVIKPKQNFGEIINLKKSEKWMIESINNYRNIFNPAVIVASVDFSCRLNFDISNELVSISLYKLCLESKEWKDWSIEKESIKFDWQNDFLFRTLGNSFKSLVNGRRYQFSWGTIESIYSSQSASSSIVIRYK